MEGIPDKEDDYLYDDEAEEDAHLVDDDEISPAEQAFTQGYYEDDEGDDEVSLVDDDDLAEE
jgi:hypothetical protein